MTNTAEAITKQIETNWSAFQSLLSKISEPRQSAIKNLVTHFESRLAVTPCSTRTEFHGAYMGGLVEHALKTVSMMGKLNKTYSFGLSVDSIVLVGLFHAVGKVGSLDKELFLEQKSDWHVKQGIMYEFNKDVPYMATPHRSLFLLQHFGVVLTEDEMVAILLADDMTSDIDVSKYKFQEPLLAFLVKQSAHFSTLQLKDKTSVLDAKTL